MKRLWPVGAISLVLPAAALLFDPVLRRGQENAALQDDRPRGGSERSVQDATGAGFGDQVLRVDIFPIISERPRSLVRSVET